jgi:hypothetical protein
MTKSKETLCPNCNSPLENRIKCRKCEFVADNIEDKWKPVNMGKQRGKPKANIDGKD